tara:strand:+ start:10 stop:978 length:969 start_codon:yes stop_codon:yes gene_type:complete
MKKKKIITGVAGFVGFSTCRNILEKKGIVIGIDNLNNYYDVEIKKSRLKILKRYKNFIFFNLDLRNQKKLFSRLKKHKFETIFHFAAQAGVRHSILNPKDYVENNIVATFNILELCKIKKINHLILASTSSVYGLTKNKKIDENFNTDKPLQFYAATKKSCELMAHSYSNIYKIKVSVLRFFTLYGPWGRPDMALFKFTRGILQKKFISVFNYGKHARDFTYIDDAVKAIELVEKLKFSKKKLYRIFNVGNGESVELKKYIKEIEKNLNMKAKITYLPMQLGDVKKMLSNNSKLNKFKEFKKRTHYKIGVKKFIDWYRDYYN